jgi:thiol-disulfide isomerase/thioredoxin
MRSLIAALVIGCSLPGLASAADVTLETVKLSQFHETVAKHKGKVVVIDFWATFCVPCMKEFPNLVELHRKYADKGLVCISVSVDFPEDKDRALKFLKDKQATFTNLLLDEEADLWQKELDFTAVPAILVYGKDGKLAKKFFADSPKTAFDYSDVRKLVLPMIGVE